MRFSNGAFVRLRMTGWLGQVLADRPTVHGGEYELRVWDGSVLFRTWFNEQELLPDDGSECAVSAAVINLATAKAKGAA